MNVSSGRSFPLGATVADGGVNFSVFSARASRLELLLFEGAYDAEPARVIQLDAPIHRTYHYWHAFVPGLRSGQVYAYRAVGPFDPPRGLRFDPAKALLDPYARAVVVPDGYDRRAASRPGANTAVAMRSVVVD
ncbi:MAG TPA: glycogen debranching enzyme, partial [Candidatus Methylomirabilis sp.]|nr:glycogen debranching enzyme [Candidatus Methylomirabilis sp.]